jgi:hypothetical protein
MSLPFIATADVEQRLSAADALEAALLPGLDPEADLPRGVLELGCSSWHPLLREILWSSTSPSRTRDGWSCSGAALSPRARGGVARDTPDRADRHAGQDQRRQGEK